MENPLPQKSNFSSISPKNGARPSDDSWLPSLKSIFPGRPSAELERALIVTNNDFIEAVKILKQEKPEEIVVQKANPKIPIGRKTSQTLRITEAVTLATKSDQRSLRGIKKVLSSSPQVSRDAINSRDTLVEQTLLHSAAAEGNMKLIELLTSDRYVEELDFNAKDLYGWTPLMAACSAGQELAIKKLIKFKQVDPSVKSNDGSTVIHYLAKHRKSFVTGLIPQLFQKGVELDAQNANGETALHIATLYKNAEAIVVLSSIGANPSKMTKSILFFVDICRKGETLLDYAFYTKDNNIVSIVSPFFPPLLLFPDKILLKIFKYLDLPSIGKAAMACHRLRDVTKLDRLWQNLCLKENILFQDVPPQQAYLSYKLPHLLETRKRCNGVESDSHFAARIVIVGDRDAGKRTFFKFVKAKPFCHSSNPEDSSLGSFYCTFPDSRKVAVTLECPPLDHRYSAHTFKNVKGVFLCHDPCPLDAAKNLENWIREILLYCSPSVEVQILITKYDLKSIFSKRLQPLLEVAKKYDLALFFVSSKNGFNTETILNEMIFRIGDRQKVRTSTISSAKVKSSLPAVRPSSSKKKENCILM